MMASKTVPTRDRNRVMLQRALKLHQVERLQTTYQDLIDSEYHQLGEFFFTDIYGPEDYSKRNEAFKRLSGFLKDAMGTKIYQGIEQLIELNDLTEELDERVLDELIKLEADENFTQADYEAAYRNADNYPERVRQIELMTTSTEFMHGMSRLKAIGWVIKGVRLAAVFIGVGEVMTFLERGYLAFRSAPDIERFNSIISEFEVKRLKRIYKLSVKKKS